MGSLLWLDETLASIHAGIERVGWALIHVSEGFRDTAWTYTIGLSTRFKHPELIVLGLDADHAEHVLNWLSFDIETGQRFAPAESRVVDGVPILFGAVHPVRWNSELFAMWHNYYRSLRRPARAAGAIQVIWPDNDPRFPGDPGFEPNLARIQPLLASDPRHVV